MQPKVRSLEAANKELQRQVEHEQAEQRQVWLLMQSLVQQTEGQQAELSGCRALVAELQATVAQLLAAGRGKSQPQPQDDEATYAIVARALAAEDEASAAGTEVSAAKSEILQLRAQLADIEAENFRLAESVAAQVPRQQVSEPEPEPEQDIGVQALLDQLLAASEDMARGGDGEWHPVDSSARQLHADERLRMIEQLSDVCDQVERLEEQQLRASQSAPDVAPPSTGAVDGGRGAVGRRRKPSPSSVSRARGNQLRLVHTPGSE